MTDQSKLSFLIVVLSTMQRVWADEFKDKKVVVEWPDHMFEHFIVVVRTLSYLHVSVPVLGVLFIAFHCVGQQSTCLHYVLINAHRPQAVVMLWASHHRFL